MNWPSPHDHSCWLGRKVTKQTVWRISQVDNPVAVFLEQSYDKLNFVSFWGKLPICLRTTKKQLQLNKFRIFFSWLVRSFFRLISVIQIKQGHWFVLVIVEFARINLLLDCKDTSGSWFCLSSYSLNSFTFLTWIWQVYSKTIRLQLYCCSPRYKVGYNPSLVLVQPRKTHPYITERLLMGHKESNQTKWDSLAMNDNGTKFCLVV